MKKILCSCALLCFLFPVEALANVYVGETQNTGTIFDNPHVIVEGEIKTDDVLRAQQAIRLAATEPKYYNSDGSPVIFVTLNSPGGDVLTAMKIGRLFRSASVQTWVTEKSTCASACVFIFSGGVTRSIAPGGRLGLHRPRFTDYQSFASLSRSKAQATYQALISSVHSYFGEMGIPDAMATKMLSVPSEKILYLDSDAAERELISGTDPAYTEWMRAKNEQRNGPSFVHKLDQLIACYNVCEGRKCAVDAMKWCRDQLNIK